LLFFSPRKSVRLEKILVNNSQITNLPRTNPQSRVIFAAKPTPVQQTLQQYDDIIARCKAIFINKNQDYGTAWRILRPSSLTDQLYIKAKRIRSIEEKQTQQVEDSIESEFIGLVNYSVMALLQLTLPEDTPLELEAATGEKMYDEQIQITRDLMIAKNHDYGEVWREMRVSSMTDLILMKLLRIKQIEDNDGKTLISEGLDANYRDIINYAIFALIKLGN
jgi:hypothetical protein